MPKMTYKVTVGTTSTVIAPDLNTDKKTVPLWSAGSIAQGDYSIKPDFVESVTATGATSPTDVNALYNDTGGSSVKNGIVVSGAPDDQYNGFYERQDGDIFVRGDLNEYYIIYGDYGDGPRWTITLMGIEEYSVPASTKMLPNKIGWEDSGDVAVGIVLDYSFELEQNGYGLALGRDGNYHVFNSDVDALFTGTVLDGDYTANGASTGTVSVSISEIFGTIYWASNAGTASVEPSHTLGVVNGGDGIEWLALNQARNLVISADPVNPIFLAKDSIATGNEGIYFDGSKARDYGNYMGKVSGIAEAADAVITVEV